ncbi:MAG: hypothetical protein K2M46_10615 [Lachnospiraceae bacterium]|nr:hypothetical protein [Lachnospiraceae bacterium]
MLSKGRKRKGKIVDYDYEEQINQSLENIHEWFIEELLKGRVKSIYALKEIKAGEQLEVEIYPQFTRQTLPKGWKIRKKDLQAKRNLNEKNARTYLERLILTNFNENGLWITLTYDNDHLPPDGDMDRADRNVANFIKRVNRYRKKKGLKNARYIYITEYKPYGELRWHHHIIMDNDLTGDEVEDLWNGGGRNNIKKLVKDENGLSGMANYLVKESRKIRNEKRWKSSKGLKKPQEKVVHYKKSAAGKTYKRIESLLDKMLRDNQQIEEYMKLWYPNYKTMSFEVKHNNYNGYYYIHTKLWQTERKDE